MAKNEDKLKAAGLRMALKMIPDELVEKAPQHLETFLTERLKAVAPMTDEVGVVYLITPDQEGHMQILTVGMDEKNTVTRLVAKSDFSQIFKSLLDNLKNL